MDQKTSLSKKEIIKNKIPRLLEDNKSGMYFLIYKKEIVYVGQAQHPFNRISHHIKTNIKIFDSYSYIPLEKTQKQLNELEAELIVKFQPKYNIRLPENEKYITLLQIKKYLHDNWGLGRKGIQIFLNTKKIKFIFKDNALKQTFISFTQNPANKDKFSKYKR